MVSPFLAKEILLLSKLFDDNLVNQYCQFMNEKVGVPLIKRQEKTKILRHSEQLIEENGATEFSNPVSKDFEIDSKKICKTYRD
jgi:hypothetical protein